MSWINNLETFSGLRLDNPKHKDHYRYYVQSYLSQFGAKKVEANALVVRPESGRKMCEEAILEYLDRDAAEKYQEEIEEAQSELKHEYIQYVRSALDMDDYF